MTPLGQCNSCSLTVTIRWKFTSAEAIVASLNEATASYAHNIHSNRVPFLFQKNIYKQSKRDLILAVHVCYTP